MKTAIIIACICTPLFCAYCLGLYAIVIHPRIERLRALKKANKWDQS